jgi:hypothetical protein
MNEPSNPPNPFDLLVEQIRQAIREEMMASKDGTKELLDAEQLAERLKVPVTWVYEQSRLGNIPTERMGKYIRFDLAEVIASQRKKV